MSEIEILLIKIQPLLHYKILASFLATKIYRQISDHNNMFKNRSKLQYKRRRLCNLNMYNTKYELHLYNVTENDLELNKLTQILYVSYVVHLVKN